MTDMTLCLSKTCRVKERCKRHSACPDAYRPKMDAQSYAIWSPPAGPNCPGFIDHEKDWRHD